MSHTSGFNLKTGTKTKDDPLASGRGKGKGALAPVKAPPTASLDTTSNFHV